MTALQQHYQDTVVPALKKEMGVKSAFAVPRLLKIVVNMGVSDPQDPRARKPVLENIALQFMAMTGQKPNITLARKSIATFKLRAGDPLGVRVTLRGKRMWQFFEKLLTVALPRVKDFQGVSNTGFDGNGNYSLGIEEQIIFPEVSYDMVEKIRSFQAVFVTTAENNENALRLFTLLGMPFVKEAGTTRK
ncbi:MAG: 50S ribosomal protein L5 [Candidatus Pacebacteria bacterium]|nr:50S ribosomal protein L5 [Candidatus Paceibacterota bacterium]PIR61075.1 MAG: 50S ribosomal protein L5 [Candidatus Pacebacteria bacterium CG10_big_fil_rev_8_21_14_0_10_45_6]